MAEFLIVAVKDSLNLRREPVVAADNIVQALPPNTVLQCFESRETPERVWRKAHTDGGAEGWVAAERLRPWGDATARLTVNVPWLNVAVKELGEKEIVGDEDNPRIVEYLHTTTLSERDAAQDETAWCSAFVNWCMKQVNAPRTRDAWAQSWLNWGQPLAEPRQGAITVFRRFRDGSEIGGHVAFFVEARGSKLLVLGGNQANAVCLREYDKNGATQKLLGYRWPAA